MLSKSDKSALPWKRPAVLAVLLATMLCTSGLVVTFQQANAFFDLRLEELRSDARSQAEQVRKEVFDQTARMLNTLAMALEATPQPRTLPTEGWPAWLGVPYLWQDGVRKRVTVRLEDRATFEETFPSGVSIDGAIRAVLNGQSGQPYFAQAESGTIVFGALLMPGEVATRLLAMQAVTIEGESRHLLALVDGKRLHRELERRYQVGMGRLSLVYGAFPEAVWTEPIGLPFTFLSWEPSSSYLWELRADKITQVSVSLLATLAALLALVGVVSGLVQIAKREMALSRMKGDFVAAVSHELKTPLALIRLFAETLKEGRAATPQKVQEYYDIIVHESTRLTHMIDNILEFSRNEAAAVTVRKKPLDVGQVVKKTYDVFRIELDEEAFQHSITIEEQLPAIEGDADAISQAIMNLLSNAVKYSDSDRSIDVTVARETRRGRRGVLISVLDGGIGIRPEDRAHLFDGFFRGDDDRVRERRGAGLGLAVVKQIVDAHGGIVEAEPRLVKGSAFRIFLPGAETPPGGEAKA